MNKKNQLTKTAFADGHAGLKRLRRTDLIQFNVLYNDWLRGKLKGRLTK